MSAGKVTDAGTSGGATDPGARTLLGLASPPPDPPTAVPTVGLAPVVSTTPQPGQGIALGTNGKISSSIIPQVTGSVAANGTVTAGTGFTVTKGATGIYTINFNTPFAAAPAMSVTIVDNAVDAPNVGIGSPYTGSQVALVIAAGTVLTNKAFVFTATRMG